MLMNKNNLIRGSAINSAVLSLGFVTALAAPLPLLAASSDSALSDEAIPLQTDKVPERVPPILEIGDTFLGAGNIKPGFTLPTGAVWQPNLIVWGNFRTALGYVDDEVVTGDDELSEWANRLDLFAQVSLSQTDRIVLGVRTFDENSLAEDGGFAGKRWEPDSRTIDPELDLSLAFLEINLAELFPGRKQTKPGGNQRRALDIDVAIGRQTIVFQGGVLVNDNMDALAVSKNNLSLFPNSTNTRAAFVYAWNEVNRGDNREDGEANFYGMFTETDFAKSTVNFDIAGIESDETGDAVYLGLSATQRIRKINTTFRLVHSEPLDDSTDQSTQGTVATAEINWTPAHTYNNIYTNFFWAEDEFNSASRDFANGGPLNLVGILYAATGLGNYPAPLGNNAINSFGGAVGYQMFFQQNRRQLILELGGRTDTDNTDRRQIAAGARFQQAIGNRFVFRFDAYVSELQKFDAGWGARTELQVKF
ncbi:MAG: hypothetical protein Hals2KO_15370 [Halioglobus sp.]